MKAVVCKQLGPIENLSVEEIDRPVLKDHELLVEVKAAGVNFPDALVVQGKYQVVPEVPYVPGAEGAGVIREVGSAVKRYAVGDEVTFTALGGAYASFIALPETACLPKSPEMSFEQAAGFTITYATSYYALKQRAHLSPGETVLVLGAAGGVGTSCIELAKAMGARVIAAASSDEKLAFAQSKGADEVINYQSDDLKARVKELTNGRGVDVVYDPVGGSLAQLALRCIAWDGRYLVVGFASDEIPQFAANLTLVKGASISGVWWGAWAQRDPKAAFGNHMELLEMVSSGVLNPQVSKSFPLSEVVDAFKELTERRVLGKIVLTL
ncbi:MAG: NADPH:quinone oxidoreductase family protein [Gammaproteobacteria bacterium]|nr:NADPH:quinone oxidoreductase family protein [Gammaproteobacteria bacterium]